MKNLIFYISTAIMLTGCVFFDSSCGGDINCNKDISHTTWYKKRASCINEQQTIAKKLLKDKYNQEIDSDIYSKCVKDKNFKFHQN